MLKNVFRHFALVCRHRHKVLVHCAKCGILFRGLVHDLSKFSPAEFWESAKYFQGNRSPIAACRKENGVSYAWLHHKGRNKHHLEYWLDGDCAVTPPMPYPYAVECVCDKLAATKTYAGKDYSEDKPLAHWLRYGNKVDGNPKTMAFLEQCFRDIKDLGEEFVLRPDYMKETYRKIMDASEESESSDV